jgi:hypothetical protein
MALVGFQGLILTWASETRNACIRLLKNKGFKEDAGRTNRVVRHGLIHDPGIQQEPPVISLAREPYEAKVSRTGLTGGLGRRAIR